jgi:membrane-associated phospholipid phosphatase
MDRLRALDHGIVRVLNAGVLQWPVCHKLVAVAARRLAAVEVALMVLLGLSGRPRAALRVLLSVGVVYAAVAAIGLRWRRHRPFARFEAIRELVPHEPARSFPSRHVASAFAMATVSTPAHPTIGRLMGNLAWALAASRVIAGLHYPTDVVAGAVLGVAVGRLFRAL